MERKKLQLLLQNHGNIFSISVICGIIFSWLSTFFIQGMFPILLGWDMAILILFILMIYLFFPLASGQQTKRIVLKGIRYPLIDLLVILAGVFSFKH